MQLKGGVRRAICVFERKQSEHSPGRSCPSQAEGSEEGARRIPGEPESRQRELQCKGPEAGLLLKSGKKGRVQGGGGGCRGSGERTVLRGV